MLRHVVLLFVPNRSFGLSCPQRPSGAEEPNMIHYNATMSACDLETMEGPVLLAASKVVVFCCDKVEESYGIASGNGSVCRDDEDGGIHKSA